MYTFWFLLDCCVVSTFILLKYFQASTGSSFRQQVFKSFKLELAKGLINDYNFWQLALCSTNMTTLSHLQREGGMSVTMMTWQNPP